MFVITQEGKHQLKKKEKRNFTRILKSLKPYQTRELKNAGNRVGSLDSENISNSFEVEKPKSEHLEG
jgi:hypothetical protein